MSSHDDRSAPAVSTLRRVIVGVIVASFTVAAVGGIIVLLGAELGDTAGKVLSSTAIVGSFSVAVLCCASLLGHRVQPVGVVGVAVSVVAAALVLWMLWSGSLLTGEMWETFFRLMWSAVAASAAFSLGSLLLLLTGRRRTPVRVGLFATLALLALLLILTLVLIWAENLDEQFFPRFIGIVAILTALGAIVVPVMSLLLRDPEQTGPAPSGISAESLARLRDEAARRGVTPDELVEALLGAPPDPQADEGS